jgi:type VI secretion system protein
VTRDRPARPQARRGRPMSILASILLTFAVAACAYLPVSIGARQVVLDAAPDMNDDSALAVDLVFVRDAELADRLAEVPAREWFARREQFQRDHPRDLEVLSFELVPGQRLPPVDVEDMRRGTRNGIVFADHHGPGDHRAQFGHLPRAVVALGKESFTVQAPQ